MRRTGSQSSEVYIHKYAGSSIPSVDCILLFCELHKLLYVIIICLLNLSIWLCCSPILVQCLVFPTWMLLYVIIKLLNVIISWHFQLTIFLCCNIMLGQFIVFTRLFFDLFDVWWWMLFLQIHIVIHHGHRWMAVSTSWSTGPLCSYVAVRSSIRVHLAWHRFASVAL